MHIDNNWKWAIQMNDDINLMNLAVKLEECEPKDKSLIEFCSIAICKETCYRWCDVYHCFDFCTKTVAYEKYKSTCCTVHRWC